MSLIGQIRFILEMQSYEKKLDCERWGVSVFGVIAEIAL